jgi:hypothetical protein
MRRPWLRLLRLGPLAPRLNSHCVLDELTGCWLWGGELNRNGYGRVWWQGKRCVVHRVVYELLHGPVSPKLHLDHVKERCQHRHCCNPAHLEPVTPRENTHRGRAVLFKKRGS